MGPRDRALLELLVATRLLVADLCALRLDGVHWDQPGPHLTWVDGRGRARVAAMNPPVEAVQDQG